MDTESNQSQISESQNTLLLTHKPRDKHKLVAACFGILGMASLLPWNFFITPIDYWMYKFRNSTAPYVGLLERELTPMQIFFESYLAIAANFPLLISMLLNSFYGQKFSAAKRIYSTLSIMLAVFILTTLLSLINTDNAQWFFFIVTMVLVVLINFSSAVFQASIFGIAALFPDRNMHILVNGQAIAGLIAATIQIVSLATTDSPIKSGSVYFMTSVCFIGLTLATFWLMTGNKYAIHHFENSSNTLQNSNNSQTTVHRQNENQDDQDIDKTTIIQNRKEIFDIFYCNWHLFASIIMSFWATIAVFPGICVHVMPIQPNDRFIPLRFYTPVATFLLYNIGDLCGRLVSAYMPFPVKAKVELLVFSILRAIFPILIIFCNVVPKENTPVIFKNDFAFPFLNALSSMTNGYIMSSAMVMAAANSPRERLELTSFVMSTSLGTALTLGSISSNLLLRII